MQKEDKSNYKWLHILQTEEQKGGNYGKTHSSVKDLSQDRHHIEFNANDAVRDSQYNPLNTLFFYP